jgi:hypothetical protein
LTADALSCPVISAGTKNVQVLSHNRNLWIQRTNEGAFKEIFLKNIQRYAKFAKNKEIFN